MADLPKIEAILSRVVKLEDGFERGQAHLYLGILHTQRPPALGGKPELAQAGGPDIDKVEALLQAAPEQLKQLIG